MSRRGKIRTEQLVRRMIEIGSEVLVDLDITHRDQAEECMRAAGEALCKEMAGAEVYIPVGRIERLRRRDHAITIGDTSAAASLAARSVRRIMHSKQQRHSTARSNDFVDAAMRNGVDVMIHNLESSDAEQIDQAMSEIVYRLCGELGGCELYFPIGMRWHLSQRDQQIWSDYRIERGVSNVLELSQRYGLTVRTIQAILARMRTMAAQDQGDLFAA
jgi:Mor family transcriptional regulator